jgi:methylmalonyl-CoA/ethylmalonyl-CoA epimerase
MINKIHHINFIVKDIELAVEKYKSILGTDNVVFDDLPGRGVKTARFTVGEVLIILIEPVKPGVPATFLEKNGEGFFMMSFGVKSLDAELERIEKAGVKLDARGARKGLDNWRIHDIDVKDSFGVQLQLCEET